MKKFREKWLFLGFKMASVFLILMFSAGCVMGNQIEAKNNKSLPVKSNPLSVTPRIEQLRPNLSKNIVVYFNPHADDEVLTFGVPIRNDLRANKEVYVVLISPGEDSIARDVVNGRFDDESFHPEKKGQPQWCKMHKRFHVPSLEGYKPLTKKAFGRERIHEFFRSSISLGVPKNHLFYYTFPNGKFRYPEIKMMMKDWVSLFPNATYKTMSKKDIHVDHAILGRVMGDLYHEHQMKNAIHYVSVATRNSKKVKFKKHTLITLKNRQDRHKIRKAIHVYERWNPAKHSFALGFHSVPEQFHSLENKMNVIETAE